MSINMLSLCIVIGLFVISFDIRSSQEYSHSRGKKIVKKMKKRIRNEPNRNYNDAKRACIYSTLYQYWGCVKKTSNTLSLIEFIKFFKS